MIIRNDSRFEFRGSVTIATVNEWLRESEVMFEAGGDWELDLSGVEAVDSAAVSLLLAWSRQAAARGHRLQLQHLPDNLQSLLKVYDVQALL